MQSPVGPTSTVAVAARITGGKFQKWLEAVENQEKAEAFSSSLFSTLDMCFDPQLTLRAREERMWGKFHQLRCSHQFSCLWNTFLMEALQVDPCQIFSQYLTDKFFREMIFLHFFLKKKQEQEHGEEALSYNEKNALRYTAGYVIRHLKKFFLIFCLSTQRRAGFMLK